MRNRLSILVGIIWGVSAFIGLFAAERHSWGVAFFAISITAAMAIILTGFGIYEMYITVKGRR